MTVGRLLAVLLASHAGGALACAPLADVAAQALPETKAGGRAVVRTFDFARLASCLDGGGRGIVVALPHDASAQLTIATLGDRRKGLMPLRVSVLDAQRTTLSRHAFDAFTQRGMRYTLTVHVRATGEAAFLLVEVDPERLGSEASHVSGVRSAMPVFAAGMMGVYADGRESKVAMPFVDAGRVEISVLANAAPR